MKENLIITGVKYQYIKDPSYPVEIMHYEPLRPIVYDYSGDYDPMEDTCSRELVRPVEFVDSYRKTRRWVGMTKEVQEAIGLPFDVFSDMSEQIYNQTKRISDLNSEMDDLKNMGFWKRVWFMVTRKVK
jgi:hypothetical protein